MFLLSWRAPASLALLTLLLAAILIASPAFGGEKTPDLQTEILKLANWRSLGPSVMGGRVADIAVEEKNPYTFYVALATGGLIKTTNNGVTFTPVFDKEAVASVGAVAVAPSDPKIVWVGTGEANGRNSSSWGDGVYKSTDGGATWKNMGLKDSQEIGRIVIDPNDPNVVYVAAAGHLWGPNKERGVFKTTDGGKTWQPSLALNADTGAIDVALGAPGSGVVYAALYQRRRTPWGFEGIGPGSGLYKSGDGGKTWKKLTNGLPTGPLGRIGISVCRSKPNIVYALIESQEGGSRSLFDTESKHGGVFRSDDAGETWKRVNSTAPRGFYFGQIRVDPTNPDRVYVLGFELSISEDGGKTFKEEGSRGVHSDLHALWIDPARPEHLLLGTDGGLYASYDRAKAWDFLNNFPMGEFYEVSVDSRMPFWVYGGLQDNACWAGPSALQSTHGPTNPDWVFLTGGDGFYVVPDPVDLDIVYAESQGGAVERIDRRTNKRKYLHPEAPEGTPSYRFNWNTPLCLCAFDRTVLYMGGNRLFKFTKNGDEWTAISPDLSKQNGARITAGGSGAETYGTIVTISASSRQQGVIWVGTDDGNVQVTQDEGATWANVTEKLPAKVRDYYVTRVEASHFVPGRAYVAIDGHRDDDFAPYLFVTEDFGQTWQSIVSDLPPRGPVKALREDPINPDLLFIGTEFGAFVSFDRGGHWHKLDNGLPTVAVNDLAIQPRDHALVAATHGRSLYVLDNIAPMEALTPQMRDVEIALFPIAPAREFLPTFGFFDGGREFRAQNPPDGVEIVYWLKSLAEKPPHVAITDAGGKSVAELDGERYPGINRLRWDLRQKESERPRRFGEQRFVKPGLYTVTLTVGKEKRTQAVLVSGPSELSEPPPSPDAP
ncbi:MAG TPA: hypothetical protein VFB38_05150 [Chthonomonadaceae bacterium]|nr:hypothetical protein [Chthonomonadaceae bacterium]